MGMSIDEAIGLLERGSQYNYYDSAEDFCKAYDMAIDTMRKYQKIEKVVAKWKVDDFTGFDGFAWDCMKEIADIVEEGKK